MFRGKTNDLVRVHVFAGDDIALQLLDAKLETADLPNQRLVQLGQIVAELGLESRHQRKKAPRGFRAAIDAAWQLDSGGRVSGGTSRS